jgi:hypothetical protein
MFSKKLNPRSFGIMKPEGVPGSSLTAIGVGLFVAFGGILFGQVPKHWGKNSCPNFHAGMTRELSEVSLLCRNG